MLVLTAVLLPFVLFAVLLTLTITRVAPRNVRVGAARSCRPGINRELLRVAGRSYYSSGRSPRRHHARIAWRRHINGSRVAV
jgi:hypothetical protein